MVEVTSLFSLCIKSISAQIINGCDGVEELFELPSHFLDGFLDGLLMELPPLALQKLHELSDSWSRRKFTANNTKDGRKRGRHDNFNTAWKILYKKRWPMAMEKMQRTSSIIPDGDVAISRPVDGFVDWRLQDLEKMETGSNIMQDALAMPRAVDGCVDWQQLYWEAHLQSCLDEAAERALLPTSDGHIGGVKISDEIMNYIGHSGNTTQDCLSFHCINFGRYARNNCNNCTELSSSASNPLMSSQNRESRSSQGLPNLAAEARASVQHPHPRPSDDIGWDWAIYSDWPEKKKIKCTLCGHESTGGISRHKEHLAGSRGNAKPCKKATPDIIARVKAAMAETKGKKSDKIRSEIERRQEVDISRSRIERSEEITQIGNKRPREFGAIHRYALFLPEEPTSSSSKKQTTVDAAERKKRRELVHEWVSLWAYEAGVPFHALMLPSFNNMCEAIGQFGPGYVGPTMYQLREPLLKKAVARTSVGLEPHKKLWETNGCTLMTDSWTDRKQRCVMNMCIHSSAGVIFYNSIEESAESHTGDFIFKWVDQCIQEIGADYVVQVVTDNHSANMAAKEKLKSERPRIFWTSCAAHTTNLMLQDIGKLDKFQNTIDRARALTVFIYSHTRTLALMRKCTRRKDIVWPDTTRFATSFLTLGSLLEKKNELMAMFNSDEFMNLKFVGGAKKKAATARATVISRSFWRGVKSCLKIFTPLFKFLRMVDSDNCPSMGFIIGELEIVKREIMAAWKIEKEHKPIISIINKHAKNRLDSPLHLGAWFLNPLFYYAEDEMAKKSVEAKQAVLDCAELFFRNGDTIDEAIVDTIYSTEMLKYRDCDAFIHGKPRAQRVVRRIAEDRNPAHWWDTFGGDMPYMQMMALRILRLTGSSSECERNWSCFEGIHTKKRNRLDSKRLSDLVYVQFNLRIRTKMDTTRKDGKKRDILLAKDARHANSWVVDGYNSEEDDDCYPGTNIPLSVISEAAGADDFLQPRRTTRRANMASTSRACEEVDLEDDEEGPIEDSASDEEDIQLDDDDSDEDALRDEILLLGTGDDDEDDE